MICKKWTTSTTTLRIGTLSLLVVLVCHVIGYGLPRWSTIHITVDEFDFKGTYHNGLWQECTCTPDCYCVAKNGYKDWQRTVQTMETLALIGIVASGVISAVFNFRPKTYDFMRKVNVGLVLVSGICMLIGAIVFGTRRHGEYKELTSYLASNTVTETNLNVSFILSVIATALCLFLTAPLFMVNLRYNSQPVESEQNMNDLTPQSNTQ